MRDGYLKQINSCRSSTKEYISSLSISNLCKVGGIIARLNIQAYAIGLLIQF